MEGKTAVPRNRRRGPKAFPRYMTRAEFITVFKLSNLSAKEFARVGSTLRRDALLFRMMWVLGLRNSEARTIQRNMFKSGPQGISLEVRGKGAKDRTLGVDKRTWELICVHVAEDHLTKRDYLFHPWQKKDRPLSRRQVDDLFKRYVLDSGIKKFGQYPAELMSPHSLRHSFGVFRTEQKVATAELKQVMGHASIDTTEIYTEMRPEAAINISLGDPFEGVEKELDTVLVDEEEALEDADQRRAKKK